MTVSRLNLFWGVQWTAVPEITADSTDLGNVDIVIGSVDTRAARRLISKKVEGLRSRISYWLDLGNTADGGQFVLGQPLNGRNRRSANRLRTAAELFPEIVDPESEDDTEPSCSAVEALERQEPFVNQVLATQALALLTRLFRHGRIEHHGGFVSVAAPAWAVPVPVSPALWRRMRHRGAKLRIGA